jgi:hypothetical protein
MLSTKNKRIVEFYKDHDELNFESVNILFVELFEKILDKNHCELNSLINNQILSTVQNIEGTLGSINDQQQSLLDTISLKLYETKNAYICDVREIISSHGSESNDRMNALIQQQNTQLIDKTALLLNDVVPKSNGHYYNQLETCIRDFRTAMNSETGKILENTDRSVLVQSIESKTNSMMQQFQQPLFSLINSGEERISKNMDKLKEDSMGSQNVLKELSDFLGKYKNSSIKGQYGETQLEGVLNKMYPSAGVYNTTGETAACDFRLERINAPVILVETKEYDRNVSIDEVKKFIRDIDFQKKHGIFISQKTGITSKQNYHIDIRGKNILVYIHNVDYNHEKIQIAVDIIDSLHSKIDDMHENSGMIDGFHVSKETVEDINREYTDFVGRKLAMISMMKDFQKRMLGELDEMKFPSLGKYLADKYGGVINDSNETIKCNICNSYEAKNNRSLASHQRKCKKILEQKNNSQEEIKEIKEITINTN